MEANAFANTVIPEPGARQQLAAPAPDYHPQDRVHGPTSPTRSGNRGASPRLIEAWWLGKVGSRRC